MPSPGERVAVTEFRNLDLSRVNMWCDLRAMKLIASKTKIMIASRSRTIHLQSTSLTPDLTVLKESAELVILGVMFGVKMTFEKHIRPVSRAAAQMIGIMRKS